MNKKLNKTSLLLWKRGFIIKKLIIVSAVIIAILSINKEENIVVPKESIRFRIVANSNSSTDQKIKKEILNSLSTKIVETNKLTSLDNTRKYINKNINQFKEIVDNTLTKNNYSTSFNINYGKNYFPKKVYKNVIYEEGEYESLVITLGDGKGKNFWCVLFPPLCMLDEDNDIEYKSLIKETLDKYF